MIRYIGIDPGSRGSIAAIDDYGVIAIEDLSNDIKDYERLLYTWKDTKDVFDETYVTVEDVCGRPGQSCVANTTFMKLAGMAELLGYNISTEGFLKVKPQVWKRHFDLIFDKSISKTEKKHKSIELAKELFPAVADQLTASKDGRAEALLIALYGKEKGFERHCTEDIRG